MPRQLFESPSASQQIFTHSRWTAAVSTLAHLVIVCVIIIGPLLATGSLPEVRDS